MVAICKYCQNEIDWKQEGGRNVPYNPDGTRHSCQKPQPQQNLSTGGGKVPVHNVPKEPSAQVPAGEIGSGGNATAPAQQSGGVREVTLECTINLDSYENLWVSVTAGDAETCRLCIVDTLAGYGTQSPATKEKIDRYVARVFGRPGVQ